MLGWLPLPGQSLRGASLKIWNVACDKFVPTVLSAYNDHRKVYVSEQIQDPTFLSTPSYKGNKA
eukprot:1721864-Amphidinium_carterae.2